MNTIYKYQPVIIPGPNGTVFEPKIDNQMNTEEENSLIHLCEIDEWKYVSVPEGLTVSVPDEVTTWEVVTIDDELKTKIRNASSYLKIIDDQVQAKIRSLYRLDQELYLSRISVGHLMSTYTPSSEELALIQKYQSDVEEIRQWSKNQRALIGL